MTVSVSVRPAGLLDTYMQANNSASLPTDEAEELELEDHCMIKGHLTSVAH